LEHIGIITDDLDRDLARFEEQGLEIYERRPGAGGFEIAYVATPDGVCLELMHEVATS
jgi:catechol 2,3-dioxygenase-like lactoylglutathione lyase family enzyme